MGPPVGIVWAGTGVAVATYLLLFALARGPVSLRPARLAWLVGLGAGFRLALFAAGWGLDAPPDAALLGGAGVAAAGLILARRAWGVRSTGAGLRELLAAACRGLFLELREDSPGRLRVSWKAEEFAFRLVEVAPRVQVLLLCPRPAPGKVALLLDWVSKQVPGPLPRVRVVLSRRENA